MTMNAQKKIIAEAVNSSIHSYLRYNRTDNWDKATRFMDSLAIRLGNRFGDKIEDAAYNRFLPYYTNVAFELNDETPVRTFVWTIEAMRARTSA